MFLLSLAAAEPVPSDEEGAPLLQAARASVTLAAAAATLMVFLMRWCLPGGVVVMDDGGAGVVGWVLVDGRRAGVTRSDGRGAACRGGRRGRDVAGAAGGTGATWRRPCRGSR